MFRSLKISYKFTKENSNTIILKLTLKLKFDEKLKFDVKSINLNLTRYSVTINGTE